MSAFREPMVWLVAALPLATVAAGIVMIATALDAPDATGADAVRRTGQQQTTDLAPDLAAARAGHAATVRIADGAIVVTSRGVAPQRLVLALHHPADAAHDVAIALDTAGAGRWIATGAVPAAHDWNVELAPTDGAWRLVGRLHDGHAALAPRFGATP